MKTLESELYRREQEFTKAKMEELEKLKAAEEARVQRSIDFKRQMSHEQRQWRDTTERAKAELEEQIRKEELEIRERDKRTFEEEQR